MKRIAFVIYRKWAYGIFENILAFQKENPNFTVSALITTPSAEFRAKELKNFENFFILGENDNDKINSILVENEIDVVCYYGWSSLVKEPILSKFICLCLHPSLLPKYRGGTPIQHQIINNEQNSGVSVFRMKNGIDDGDIYKQLPMSLSGALSDIFTRMTDLGTVITKQFISDLIQDTVIFTPQKSLDKNPPLKRRTHKDSEIFMKEIYQLSYNELYNKVRALADPYPNAFISFSNGKLFIQEIKKYDGVPLDGIILNEILPKKINQKNFPLYLHLSNGYVGIKKYKIDLSQ